MIEKIKKHPILAHYITDACCENDISVTFDDKLNADDYVIIKVDDYYNSLNIEKRPASVDCLIVRKCVDNGYGLTLVELKNIRTTQGFEIDNLKEKFDTTLNDFIKKKI